MEECSNDKKLRKKKILVLTCFVSACFHALCYAYLLSITIWKLTTNPFPWRESLLLLTAIPQLAFSYSWSQLIKFEYLWRAIAKNNDQTIIRLEDHDFESKLIGTALYEEATWNMTKYYFIHWACVYACVFVLEATFKVSEAWFFSLVCAFVFSAYMMFTFGQSFSMNLMILRRATSPN